MAPRTCTPVLAFTLLGACTAQPDPASEATDPGPQTTNPDPGPTTGSATPTTGNPSTSSTGDPSMGDRTTGDPSTGDPSTGDPSTGDPSTGDPSTGDPSTSGDTGVQCELTLDVLFLVARTSGMLENQEKLRSAVPGFFGILSDADLDLRVMVSDIDRSFGSDICEDSFCSKGDDTCAEDPSYQCAHSPTECDALYGASVTYPYGIGASNMDCGFGPFLADLDLAALDCALTMGEGTNSVDFGSTLSGVLGATNAPCNGGFIRDQAKLAIVVLSGSDDTSFTEPAAWIEKTLATRSKESVAIIALTGDTPKIDQFVAAFPFTHSAEIGAADYADAINEGAALALNSFCE